MIRNGGFKVLVRVAGEGTWSINGHVFLFNEILKESKAAAHAGVR